MEVKSKEKDIRSNFSNDFRVEMKIGNSAKIMKLIRSTIYTYPIQTLCQEYLSNARDANIAAGRASIPVEISLPTALDLSLKIRDFGNALTVDEVENIFCNLGVSTKDNSDELLGGFGVGSKSCFSYSDSFFITSFKDSVRNEYISHLGDSDSGTLEKLSKTESSEKDGILITIPLNDKEDCAEFIKAVLRATFFWEVRPIFTNADKAVSPPSDLASWYSKSQNSNSTSQTGYSLKYSWASYHLAKPLIKNSRVDIYNASDISWLMSKQSSYEKFIVSLGGIPYPGSRLLISTDITQAQHDGYVCVLKANVGELTPSVSRESLTDNDKNKSAAKSILSEGTQLYVNALELIAADNMNPLSMLLLCSTFTKLKAHGVIDYKISAEKIEEFEETNFYSNTMEPSLKITHFFTEVDIRRSGAKNLKIGTAADAERNVAILKVNHLMRERSHFRGNGVPSSLHSENCVFIGCDSDVTEKDIKSALKKMLNLSKFNYDFRVILLSGGITERENGRIYHAASSDSLKKFTLNEKLYELVSPFNSSYISIFGSSYINEIASVFKKEVRLKAKETRVKSKGNLSITCLEVGSQSYYYSNIYSRIKIEAVTSENVRYVYMIKDEVNKNTPNEKDVELLRFCCLVNFETLKRSSTPTNLAETSTKPRTKTLFVIIPRSKKEIFLKNYNAVKPVDYLMEAGSKKLTVKSCEGSILEAMKLGDYGYLSYYSLVLSKRLQDLTSLKLSELERVYTLLNYTTEGFNLSLHFDRLKKVNNGPIKYPEVTEFLNWIDKEFKDNKELNAVALVSEAFPFFSLLDEKKIYGAFGEWRSHFGSNESMSEFFSLTANEKEVYISNNNIDYLRGSFNLLNGLVNLTEPFVISQGTGKAS